MAIQIGKLRKWTPKGKTKEEAFFKTIKNFHYPDLKTLFDNIEVDLPKFLGTEEHINLFYTVAHHLEGKRYKSSWQAQEIIPFDLDGIDLDRIDEYPPIVAEACGFDLSKTAIVYSGNGCHILVQVERITDDEYIKRNKAGYVSLLERIEKACKENGLPFDKDSTAWDYARILRLPFTINKKVKKVDGEEIEVIKQARLIQNNLEAQDWTVPEVTVVEKSKFMAKGSFPLADHASIVNECEFFKWLQDKPDEVHEPHAYAMLSISGHFMDDQNISKSLWSKFSSPSILSKDLVEFTDQALRTAGPRTCEGINELWQGCSNCPHYNKVTSPILLKGKDFIGTAHCGFTLKGPRGGVLRQYEDLLKAFDNQYAHKSCGPIKKIYIWTGTHYKIADQIEIKNYAYQQFIPISKNEERKEFLSLVTDSGYVGKEFLGGDSTAGFVNFKNGVLNIETGELLDHDSNKAFLYCLPFEYDINATCDKYDAFIEEITLGRQDLQDILNEYLGFIISGDDYKYQKALILDGSGKNGKSTFVNLIRDLVGGENCSSISIAKLEGNTFASSGLHGKLVNFSEEEPAKTFSETNGVFKNITGDGIVNAEYKFGDAFEFENKAKLIITYNEIPYLKDTSTGMLRRLLIIPFDYDLEKNPDKVNPNIKKDLRSELSGIFNRALEGWRRLEDQKAFTHSKHVTRKVEQVHRLSDTVKAFLDENVEKVADENSYVTYNDLYNAFAFYSEDENSSGKILSKKGFSLRLKKYGHIATQKKIRGKNQKIIQYVTLNSENSGGVTAAKF